MIIHSSWKPLFDKLLINIDDLYSKSEGNIYPPKELVFRVFEISVYDINIVLLGQDPYYNIGQANGLSFSVSSNIPIPPSLKNIFKELKLEYPDRNYEFTSGNLEQWLYRENIFLLNSSLTVLDSKPGCHMKIWEQFTNDVIKFISTTNANCIFLLLGNYAKKKEKFIEDKKRIVMGPHPSPLARGFIGSNIFIQLEKALNKPINWSLTS